MKSDAVSPDTQSAQAREARDAAVQEALEFQRENQWLRVRLAHVEAALARCQTTDEKCALNTESGQRQNVNDAIREALITSLQSDNKQLMIRINKDALNLTRAEERLREMSTDLILAHEEEQRRIAGEMHDELGQELTALKLLIGRMKRAKEDEAKTLLAEAEEVSETLLQTVRNICSQLRPQVLDDLGLTAGLSAHLKNFGTRSGVSIEFIHGTIDESRLTPIVQSVIFRVVQEAVTNVARHAKTEHATVTMAMDAESIEFAIEDKGCGFEGERLKEARSMGLSSMVERVLLVDGVCEILSTSAGTTVTAGIPLRVSERGKEESCPRHTR